MSENVYLKGLRDQYDGLKKNIEGFQARAVEAKRDLTPDELRTIKEQGDKAATLYTQIEDLTEIETRNAKVAQMAAQIHTAMHGDGSGGPNLDPQDGPIRLGGATTQDRDPGHYRSLSEGGQNSFFRDLYRSRHGDDGAARRLVEHTRALDTGTEGVGIVAPKWLVDEFAPLARQGRALANAVRNIPLGDDPRPITLPKQTGGTDAEVTEQANENDPVDGDDAWDSDVDTVAPKPTSGTQNVSRQMLDMSSPAVDVLIYGDLIAAYNLKVERKVGAAILAIGTPLLATATQFADLGTDETNGIDLSVNAALAVRQARKLPATILAMEVATWGRYKKLKDASGRQIVPSSTAGPVNVLGVGTVNADGIIEDLPAIVTEGMDDGVVDQETYAAIRASDVLLFESNMMRFRYEQPLGPSTIKLGIWAYTAVKVRYGTAPVKLIRINTAG
ncbi:phage major capsid protein [Micromonospora sp. NPDC050417]|uniref:phage major capsid family protein n=1 Tax=Micromonospora sp. NPDC050417 TaxID=3364280 RepID=UPI0037910A0A